MTTKMGNTGTDSAGGQRHWSQSVDGVVAMVLAAGSGSRLAPLTFERPKPLCPVGGRPLLDLALQRLVEPGLETISDVVVNVHHHAASIVDHLGSMGGHVAGISDGPRPDLVGVGPGPSAGADADGDAERFRVWVSHERDRALGTAGAIGNIRSWLDGRGVMVINADTWTTACLSQLLQGWDPANARVLVVGDGFGPTAQVAGALVPWTDVLTLPDTPAGLYEKCWAGHMQAGTLDVVGCEGLFVDCGTPASYLQANMLATAGVSSVDPTATVRGLVTRCVVWPGAVVESGEQLIDAVRTTAGRTVLVRTS